MNLPNIGWPRITLYAVSKFVTLKISFSVRKLSGVPNVTDSSIRLRGMVDELGVMSWKGLTPILSSDLWIPILSKVLEKMRLSELPPSTRVLENLTLSMVSWTTTGCRTPPLGSPRVAHTTPRISSRYPRTPKQVDIIVIHRINTIIKHNTEFITIEARRHNLTNSQNTAEIHKSDPSPTGSLSADETGFSNLHLLLRRSRPLDHLDPQLASMST